MTLKVLSYNILRGGDGREKQIGAVISACAPDLVIFQEAYSAAVVGHLAAACGMPHWAASTGHSVGFISRVPVASHVWRRVRIRGASVGRSRQRLAHARGVAPQRAHLVPRGRQPGDEHRSDEAARAGDQHSHRRR